MILSLVISVFIGCTYISSVFVDVRVHVVMYISTVMLQKYNALLIIITWQCFLVQTVSHQWVICNFI